MASQESTSKQCRVCGETKPRDAFPKHGGTQCLACKSTWQRAYNAAHKEEDQARSRQWRKNNHEYKQAYDASYYERHKDALIPHMRAYRLAHLEEEQRNHRAYYRAHKDEQYAKKQQYRATHPEQRKTEYRARRERHRDQDNARSRAYTAQYPERKSATGKRWRDANMALVRNLTRKRRARIANAPINDLTPEQEATVIAAAQGRCVYCPVYYPDCQDCLNGSHKLSIDHIHAIANGGPNTLSNVVAACGWCNSKKGTKPPPVNPTTLETKL